jgi:predicted RNase H-like HicB family nuclease
MNAKEFKKWLAARGCTFEAKKGGSGHLIIRRGSFKSELPMRSRQGAWHGPCQRNQKATGTKVMLDYKVQLAPDDNGTVLVSCQQLPIVATFGENKAEALRHAVDAIETALASMIDDGEDIPRPSRSARAFGCASR